MFLKIVVVCLASSAIAETWTPSCSGANYELLPTPDCKGYYLCVNGKTIKMPNCPPGSTFSASAHVCVPEGSYNDDCKKEKSSQTVTEQCYMSGGIITHPTSCQLYYNCSMVYTDVPRFYEQHLMECPYPQLFNAENKQCEHFENVKCGSRTEPKNGCDYISNQCPSAHCIPCSFRIPSCEGFTDGVHVHEQKSWSPFYVVCYKERFVTEDRCPADSEGRTQLFHPDLNQCVSLDLIPREHGGMMPECQNKGNGKHLDDFGRCDRYLVCEGGRYVNTVKCNDGELFDALFRECKPADKVCGPCGNSTKC